MELYTSHYFARLYWNRVGANTKNLALARVCANRVKMYYALTKEIEAQMSQDDIIAAGLEAHRKLKALN